MKILIVDDALAARMMLKNCLPKNREFQILEAGNGEEGLKLFREEKPDITFLDLTMPVMDGFEALEKIKAENDSAIVIVLTADIQNKSVERVEKLGAYSVLKKLPSPEIVEKTIMEIEELLKK